MPKISQDRVLQGYDSSDEMRKYYIIKEWEAFYVMFVIISIKLMESHKKIII